MMFRLYCDGGADRANVPDGDEIHVERSHWPHIGAVMVGFTHHIASLSRQDKEYSPAERE